MSEIAQTTEHEAITEPVLVKGSKRDLLPYRLIELIEFVRTEAGNNDARLERSVAIVETWVKKKVIPKQLGDDLKVLLMETLRDNDHVYDALSALQNSGYKPALEEVNRVKRIRREIAQDVNGVRK